MKVWIFFGFSYLYRKKVVWIMVLDLGCEMSESVDFSGVWRYLVRYFGFVVGWLESGDFVGFGGILVGDSYFCSYLFFSWCVDEPTTAWYWKQKVLFSFCHPHLNLKQSGKKWWFFVVLMSFDKLFWWDIVVSSSTATKSSEKLNK